jgi:hypothetical protein
MAAPVDDKGLNDLISCVANFSPDEPNQWEVSKRSPSPNATGRRKGPNGEQGSHKTWKEWLSHSFADFWLVYDITHKVQGPKTCAHSGLIPNGKGAPGEPVCFKVVMSGPNELQLKELLNWITRSYIDPGYVAKDEYDETVNRNFGGPGEGTEREEHDEAGQSSILAGSESTPTKSSIFNLASLLESSGISQRVKSFNGSN